MSRCICKFDVCTTLVNVVPKMGQKMLTFENQVELANSLIRELANST